MGKQIWKHFPGRHPDTFKKQSILERADAARPEFEYVELADGRLVAINAGGEHMLSKGSAPRLFLKGL